MVWGYVIIAPYSHRSNIEKYLKIVGWATARYRKNGRLIVSIGGEPSNWKQIEILAFDKYIIGKA